MHISQKIGLQRTKRKNKVKKQKYNEKVFAQKTPAEQMRMRKEGRALRAMKKKAKQDIKKELGFK